MLPNSLCILKICAFFPTIHALHKYLLSKYYVPGNLLSAGNLVVNKTDMEEQATNKQGRTSRKGLPTIKERYKVK